jgi:hypothetical protein
LKNKDSYILLGFLFFPYFLGVPIWYLMTDTPQPLFVELVAPWFVGLISLSAVPLLVAFHFILFSLFCYIRNLWVDFNKK